MGAIVASDRAEHESSGLGERGRRADMRYFVRQHERLIADFIEALESYQGIMRGVVVEQSAANAKLVVCLDNNTDVLAECRDELRYARIERGDKK